MDKNRKGTIKQTAKQQQERKSSQNFNPQDYVREGITLKDVQSLKECFDSFDINGDGSLSLDEIKQQIKSYGMEESFDSLHQRLLETDSDNSGTIEFSEFLNWIGLTDKNQITEDLFKLAGQGKDKITQDDLIRINKEIKGAYTLEDLKMMITACDENKSGAIELQEFVKAILE